MPTKVCQQISYDFMIIYVCRTQTIDRGDWWSQTAFEFDRSTQLYYGTNLVIIADPLPKK